MAKAILTCLECGAKEEIEIPKDKCLPFYKCKACKKLIFAPKESCCVICSYSDKKCPVHEKA